jgi:manganese transport protein
MNNVSDSELKPLKKFFMWLVGPAIVMTAGIMGAGSTVSLVSSGCYFKYELLWAVVLSLPAVVVAQDTAARFGAAGGIGTMQLIDRETFIGLKWIILIPALLGAILANIGQLGAMAAAAVNFINLAAGKTLISTSPTTFENMLLYIPLAIFAILIGAFGGYKRIEKLFAYLLVIVLISFLIVAIQAFLHYREIILMLKGLLPNLPPDLVGQTAEGETVRRSSIIFFAAIIGGGLAMTAILSYPYFMAEGGYDRSNVKQAFNKHLMTYGVLFGVYSVILLVAGGFALNGQPGFAGFQGARTIGMALQSALGPVGTVFFSIGLFICGFTTLTVLAQLCSYFILDAIGKDWRFTKENKWFLIPFLSFIIIPALIGSFWHYPNILKVVIGMVFNSIITPTTIILLLYLANKKSLMGDLKASVTRNIFLVYTMALILFTCILGFIGFLKNFSEIFK